MCKFCRKQGKVHANMCATFTVFDHFSFHNTFDLMNIRFGSKKLPQHFKNFVAIEVLVIPPLMNSLIYGFKLTKIRNRLRRLLL